MGIFDFLKENDEAVANETMVSPSDSLDEMTVEGNDVETGMTMEEIEDLVSKVLSRSNTSSKENVPKMRLGAPSSGSTPEKVIFKGFKQMLSTDFEDAKENDPESLLGFMTFVRETTGSTSSDVYIGTRKCCDIPKVIDCGEY